MSQNTMRPSLGYHLGQTLKRDRSVRLQGVEIVTSAFAARARGRIFLRLRDAVRVEGRVESEPLVTTHVF